MNKFNRPDIWISCMRFGRFMGCHQRPDRSFFHKGQQFPVCARCTGVFVGEFAALILFLLKIRINIFICVVLMSIMFIDWLIQNLNILESTNKRRMITGIIGGYGYMQFTCKIIFLLKNLLFEY